MPTLSVIIPAKNEEETLPRILADLAKVIPTLKGWTTELIVVNDKSTDRTVEVARAGGARVIDNTEPKSGKGVTLVTGFKASTGEVICMMDADYSHRAEELPLFLEAIQRENVGLVIGSRVVGGSEEYHHVRALGNVFLSAALGMATGRYLSDALNGYKAFKRDVYTMQGLHSRNFEIEIEIIANTLRMGYKIVEVTSHERARAGGEMKSRVVRHGFRFLFRIIYEGLRGVRRGTVSGSPASAGTAAAGR